MSSSADRMLIPLNGNSRRKSESEDEENKDRLSDLSDCILLHILSFVKAKHAVQTCVLSTRWKDLWKYLPTLILHSLDFSSLPSFTKFVSRLLTIRDGSTVLQGLDFEHLGWVQPNLLKRIVKYAVLHNIQRLGLIVTTSDIEHIPNCIFSSQTLTSLKLLSYGYTKRTLFPKSLNLPALTTLHLVNFDFCVNDDGVVAEPFSVLNRLNSLIIENCNLSGAAYILCISSKTLTNLTVLHPCQYYKVYFFSPSLRTFAFTGTPFETLCGINISSIEHVNFDIHWWCAEYSFILLSWLVNLTNIKSLTVSTSTLQVLFSIPYLWEFKSPILGSLKSLKIKLREDKLQKVPGLLKDPFSSVPDWVVDYLLQNSPSAKVDIIRY
ncbi:F-box/FBD/LRR-repeat protein At3g26920-like [Lotus japonicus]|uniref:F-box/FBD/LRR-repeat protein At3g26920-like n=1 Tax=Lotus japonicus TaxID=34305 RepID=UPI00258630E8|nr:F-box/FBD/LRR-repeat protein At3g26920-like [Lotus japonicus]